MDNNNTGLVSMAFIVLGLLIFIFGMANGYQTHLALYKRTSDPNRYGALLSIGPVTVGTILLTLGAVYFADYYNHKCKVEVEKQKNAVKYESEKSDA